MHFLSAAAFALLSALVAAQTPIESRTVNTEVAITTVSPTASSTEMTPSDSRTANTIVSGPTTISPSNTMTVAASSDEHTANTIVSGPTTESSSEATAAPMAKPLGLAGAMVAIGVGMVV